MRFEFREGPCDSLQLYGTIPSSFAAEAILEVDELDSGSLRLRQTATPRFTKDYDTEPGHAPKDWGARFDTSVWRLFTAWSGATPVGGLLAIHDAPEVDMLEGRSDLVLLWDVRVHPDVRGHGIGRELLRRLEAWAAAQGYSELKVETQNINVVACRFYEACGFVLRRAVPGAYPTLPDEVMLLWYKRIGDSGGPAAS
jgi:GNAT superfamily N-acetyltransferase